MSRQNIGELLVRKNLINIDQLEKAKREQKQAGGSFTSTLVKMGYVKDKDLTSFISEQTGVPAIDLDEFEIEEEALKALPKDLCLKHKVFPISKSGNVLVVAFADPSNLFIKDDVQFISRCKVEVVLASEISIERAISKYYSRDHQEALGTVISQIEDTDMGGPVVEDATSIDENSDSAVVKFVNMILAEAIRLNASDIHIEPYEQVLRVRFRVDGHLIEKVQPPKAMKDSLSSRIKIMANLDIAERRKPQDGRVRVKTASGAYVDFRVNILPVVHGEKIVMRILDKSNLKLDLADLGFEKDDLDVFLKAIHQPQGLILVTGPTGSGKTTTLYSALAELNDPKKNLSTAEDPVEFNVDGINQVQMNPKVGLDFASALRAFLRQDPDVILVGEIRDQETAEVAFKAASTGHMVLSTLHTNDAPSTVVRLLNMGIPGYMVTTAVSLVMAQRLVGTICNRCKAPVNVSPDALLTIGVPEADLDQFQNLYRGEGCADCNYGGMKGRMAIYEVMTFSDTLKNAILKDCTPAELKAAALAGGMRSLRQAGIEKIKQGLTTIEEVFAKTVPDDEV